jgi:hypothetical protein
MMLNATCYNDEVNNVEIKGGLCFRASTQKDYNWKW